jgi:hypothetical protein
MERESELSFNIAEQSSVIRADWYTELVVRVMPFALGIWLAKKAAAFLYLRAYRVRD